MPATGLFARSEPRQWKVPFPKKAGNGAWVCVGATHTRLDEEMSLWQRPRIREDGNGFGGY